MPPRALVATLVAAAASLAAAGPAAAALTWFSTPSRNIGCIGDRSSLRCDIGQTSVPKPKRPARCPLDYGDAFSMTPRGTVIRVCHGDTTLGARRILGYGRSLRVGPFTCTSRPAALTCVNRARHGWSLSRERIRIF